MASSHVLRWAVILSAYNYSIVYKKGQHIPQAEAMSRFPSTAPVGVKECNFLNLLTPLVYPDEMAQEIKKDQVLSKVIKVCVNGWPHHCSNKILKPFFTIRNQLSKVVIPQSLQAKVLSSLHHGHAGVIRTRMLARSYALIKNFVEQSSVAQLVSKHRMHIIE
ncbi:hypothetical protein PR048_030218 [Dryococelus australis]|uniref:Uncharacterized protein n=1 Tax=Dryococelus australis TaxID=614101 RepID=A0ABQ9GC77_9NEOP|nr:hypothetical protein PR048_030218 [Dryococelus australis]